MITLAQWGKGSLDTGAEYWTDHPHHIRGFAAMALAAYKEHWPGLLANAMEDLRTEVGIACDEYGLCDTWFDYVEEQELDLIRKGIIPDHTGTLLLNDSAQGVCVTS